MAKKKKSDNVSKKKDSGPYCCPCGSSSFVEEGFGTYTQEVTLADPYTITAAGDYSVEPSTFTIKCAQCGKET